MRLTDLSIRKLSPPTAGQKTHFDEALPGFGIRISQGGTKSFIVMYGSKRRLKTIGRYPEMKLANARLEAKRIQSDLSLLHQGGSNLPSLTTFEETRTRFLSDCKSRNKPRTIQDYRRLLNRHFQFKKNIDQITRKDIMSVVSSLSSTPSESQHAYVAIRTMMNWCVSRGLVDISPVPAISFKMQARDRMLSDNELCAVFLRATEFRYPYGPIVQFLILTGQRRSEIAGLRWSWIQDDEIVFPREFTKNKREHRLPLGEKTKSILQSLPEGPDLIFPSRLSDKKPFNGWSKAKRAFDKTINVSDYTLHDLRRTYSSNLARLGVPIHVTEKLLNHISGTVSGVAAVYNRYSYADEMQEATGKYESFLADIINK